MVFVANLVPDEFRRITEFLNEEMNPAEVYTGRGQDPPR